MGNTDSIPVLSQVKSLFQVISGDEAGARRTQENFRDTCVIVSQITSLAHAIEGNEEKARAVQEKFAKNLDEITDGLPIYGHIKGAIHYALGNEERGENAMKSASGSLVTIAAGVAGFFAGGPAGAAAASMAASHAFDGVVTAIDTARHGTREDGSAQYYGSWNSYDRIAKGKADAGEFFDSVGMQVIDAASGAFGGAKLKLKSGRFRPKKIATRSRIRCRRDVEYHLTEKEVQFATSHQKLPGSVSEVLTANWQHLSAPQTVSNLVSLFVILRLILWNDKNGRKYSKELCIATEFDHVERCQNALMKTLRDMDDHLALRKADSEYVVNPNRKIKKISGNNTRTMIRIITSLYGILESMAKGDEIGIAWLAELCAFEDISTIGICEKEVVHKLNELSNQAFSLGKARKHRIKRSGCPSTKPNARKTATDNSGSSRTNQGSNPATGNRQNAESIGENRPPNQGSNQPRQGDTGNGQSPRGNFRSSSEANGKKITVINNNRKKNPKRGKKFESDDFPEKRSDLKDTNARKTASHNSGSSRTNQGSNPATGNRQNAESIGENRPPNQGSNQPRQGDTGNGQSPRGNFRSSSEANGKKITVINNNRKKNPKRGKKFESDDFPEKRSDLKDTNARKTASHNSGSSRTNQGSNPATGNRQNAGSIGENRPPNQRSNQPRQGQVDTDNGQSPSGIFDSSGANDKNVLNVVTQRKVKKGNRNRKKNTNGGQQVESNNVPAKSVYQKEGANDKKIITVGTHTKVKKSNQIRNKNIKDGLEKLESNHVPAKSAYPPGTSEWSLPAHSLPRKIHHIAMSKVGDSDSGKVARTLQRHQRQLVKNGKMAEAIKLVSAESYGRSNTLANFMKGGKTTSFKSALVEYKNDLKKITDLHKTKGTITDQDVTRLHKFLDQEENAWNRHAVKSAEDWEGWMKRMEDIYEDILRENGLEKDPDMYVPQRDRDFG